MSTAVPLPLDPTPHSAGLADAKAAEAQALRHAVAERLEQHRRRRGTARGAQGALPGMDAPTDTAWTPARPNRIADSVAARFARSQSYRDFLQQEAEAATRQAEAAAEIARRNADAVAAAQQQLLDEMRLWEERQFAPAEQHTAPADRPSASLPSQTAAPEPANLAWQAAAANERTTPLQTADTRTMPAAAPAGVLVPLPTVADAAPGSAPDFAAGLPDPFSVLAPSEASRQAPAAQLTAAPAPAAPAVAAVSVAAPAAAPPRFALPLDEPLDGPIEPPTPIPANLIEFPRQLVAARKARPRLAEGPLRDEADLQPERAQLRIFEVEASSFSTTPTIEPVTGLPEWTSIHLDSSTAPHELAQPDAQVSLAMPVYAAPLERRVMAAAVDSCCVGTAFLLAVAAAGLAGDALPTGMLALGAGAVTLLLFALGYLLLSFSLSGQTPGMRYARIALCTFGDDNPTRAAMLRRLFATVLSAGSLGLGFAWALLDDDKLGWHDRMSRMYQRAY